MYMLDNCIFTFSYNFLALEIRQKIVCIISYFYDL
jgi:hypothetical protein